MFAINTEDLKKLKYHAFLEKHQVFIFFTIIMVMNMKKTFQEVESIKIIKFLGLVNDIEVYQKICKCLKKT